MKVSKQILVGSSQKENLNHLNQVVSPDPSRNLKHDRTKNQRKVFMTMINKPEFCSNLDGRPATHLVSYPDQVLFQCQKCAIIAASKGFPVEKMISQKQKSSRNTADNSQSLSRLESRQIKQKSNGSKFRSNTIKSLKQRIAQGSKVLECKINEIEELLSQSGQSYGSLIEQVASYFETVEQMMQYQKYLAYNKILSARVIQQKDIRQFKQYILTTIQQLECINQDLNDNQEAVFEVSHDQFSSIINDYQLTVQRVSEIAAVQPQIQVFKYIHLPQICQTLAQLQKNIQLFDQNQLKFNHTASAPQIQEHDSRVKNIFRNQDSGFLNPMQIRMLPHDPQKQVTNRSAKLDQHNLSWEVQEHSFNDNSKMMRINLSKHNKITNDRKQIILENGFSIASSIMNQQNESSSQNEDQIKSNTNRRAKCRINLFKNSEDQQIIIPSDQSLGQYFEAEQTIAVNNTDNQKSQTLLLNH